MPATDKAQVLSDYWNQLRNAALGRGLSPNVSPVLATLVGEQYEKWRTWLESQGALDSIVNALPFTDEELAMQTRQYNAARTAVSTELPDSSLPPALQEGTALEHAAEAVEKAAGKAAVVLGLGIAAGLGFVLVQKFGGKR